MTTGELMELDQEKLPAVCSTAPRKTTWPAPSTSRSSARRRQDDAGPTNNWMAPEEAYAKVGAMFDGCMKGRTMYVVPFIMGVGRVAVQQDRHRDHRQHLRRAQHAHHDPHGQGGVPTNSATDEEFTKCLHCKGELDIERRFILHFPEDNTIWSFGSGYGGNVLLGKKCLALRIASYLGLQEGWMAEHMLILGIETPEGEITLHRGAFPSACGKTNLAMLIPPEGMPGYKVWTVGDDIAWMRIGPDGRLWAVNPEAGFFGVAPGTSYKSNPNAMETFKRNSIFTNVLLTPENTVWWEGMGVEPPSEGIDWKGKPVDPADRREVARTRTPGSPRRPRSAR